jgi:hypothetical protein
MSTLWIFGCSYSAEYTHRGNITKKFEKYKEYKNGTLPDVWGKILSDKLNYEYINCADGGVGNEYIFEQVCKNSENFKKDDILIIEWSYIERFRWILNNEWVHTTASNVIPIISREFCDETLKMKTHPLFIKTIFEYEKIIEVLSRAIGFNVFFWMGDYKLQEYIPKDKKLNRKYIASKYIMDNDGTIFWEILNRRKGQTIFNETGGLVDDNHFGEVAHKIMAELFYEHIKDNI